MKEDRPIRPRTRVVPGAAGAGAGCAAIVVLLTASCARQAAVRVRVADAADAGPIGGALVRAMPLDINHPLDIGAALNPAKPRGTDARTRADSGEATVRSAAGKPVRIYVSAAGFVPWGHLFDTPPERVDVRLEPTPRHRPDNP